MNVILMLRIYKKNIYTNAERSVLVFIDDKMTFDKVGFKDLLEYLGRILE